jgi:hypothetical protein
MQRKLNMKVKVLTGLIILAVVAVSALIITRDSEPASAAGGPNVDVSFTKWVNGFPNMEGVVECDAGAGTFDGLVLNAPDLSAPVTKVVAEYGFVCDQADHSFTALMDVRQDNNTGKAVLNGVVTEGLYLGAQVHGTYDVISCDKTPNDFPGTCFQGTLRIMTGSAAH